MTTPNERASATQIARLAKRQPQYCAMQRNAIAYHRSQIRFIGDLYRQNKGDWNLRLIRSHADEIRTIYSQLNTEATRP